MCPNIPHKILLNCGKAYAIYKLAKSLFFLSVSLRRNFHWHFRFFPHVKNARRESKEKRRKSEIEIETDAKSYIRFSNDNIRCCRRIESCHDLDVGRRNKEEFSRFFLHCSDEYSLTLLITIQNQIRDSCRAMAGLFLRVVRRRHLIVTRDTDR